MTKRHTRQDEPTDAHGRTFYDLPYAEQVEKVARLRAIVVQLLCERLQESQIAPETIVITRPNRKLLPG